MKTKIFKYSLISLLIIILLLGWFLVAQNNNQILTTEPQTLSTATSTAQNKNLLAEPISNALTRITKKPFGLQVSPKNSPVQPERFSGYHTGTDFETTTAEQKIDVPIHAICDGQLILKKIASGYGGVAIQACKINNKDVTVVYGHLRLSSISSTVGDGLKAGQQIGILGTGFSKETDGERKHLHLGVHFGATINLLGYVPADNQLNGWLNVADWLK